MSPLVDETCGLTPIPCIPPRQYLEGLDGELIDVTGFSAGPYRPHFNEAAFRATLEPRPDHLTNLLGLAFTLALMALAIVPLAWWLS